MGAHRAVAYHSSAMVKPRTPEEDYLCEFYKNIWASGDENKRRNKKQTRGPLIDISQVAHVVTTMTDYRHDYVPLSGMQRASTLQSQQYSSANTITEQSQRYMNLWVDPIVTNPLDPNGVEDTFDTDPDQIMSPIHSHLPHRISELTNEDDIESSKVSVSVATTNEPAPELDEFSGCEDETPLTYISVGDNEQKRGKNTKPGKLLPPGQGGNPKVIRLPSAVEPLDAVPPPTSKANGSVVFSSVFVEERDWSWAVKFLLSVHEPIRHALFVMDRFLEQSHRLDQISAMETHVNEFFTWFKTYFVEYLTCQHDVKITVLHPLINVKLSTKQEIIKTYEEIYEMLAHIQQLDRALCTNGAATVAPSMWLVRLDVLQKEIRKLNLTVHAVLNLEEKTLNPAMSASFTQKTFHNYVMPRIFRAIRAKRVVVPWIVERSKVWGGDAEQEHIHSMMPFSAKFLYRRIWKPYFVSNVAGTMKNLNEFAEMPMSTASTASSTEQRREDAINCAIM